MKKTGIFFSISSLLKSGGTMLAGLIMIRWIDPYEIGLWQSIWVFSSYTGVLQLGVMSGLNREIPFHLGADSREHAFKLAATGEFFALMLAAFAMALTILCLLVWQLVSDIDPARFWGIAGVGMIVAANFNQNYLVVTYRSSSDFRKLAEVYFIDSALIMVLLLLIYRFHYYGIIAYYVLNAIVITVLLYIKRPIRVKPALAKELLFSLIRTWLPVFFLSWLKQISKTFPRVILLSVGGILAVGYFAPAQAIQTAMLLLPNVLAQYIYPQMSFRYGQSGNKMDLWTVVSQTLKYLFLFGVPLVVAGWFLLPPFIKIFFPKYVDSILASRLMLVAGLFLSSTLVYNAFYSIKAFRQDLWLTMIMLCLNAALPLLFAFIMKPLEGVAMGWLLACFMFFVVMVAALRKNLYDTKTDAGNDIPGFNTFTAD
jgi:O-antigen/teichoic acid export membrane protein